MTRIIDLFGHDTNVRPEPNWKKIVREQRCPFIEGGCYKVRKSEPDVAIGTCTVDYGDEPIVICPSRFLDRKQIFVDCIHLLTGHEPGNELHILSEVGIPGGSIDYMLASIRSGKVRDFVGIEIQTLDTTGTVWPERQRFLRDKRIPVDPDDAESEKSYGMNWKMTSKTILVQLHHKIQTFEAVNKHLVLAVQDRLLDYMSREFSFDHLSTARTSDPMHFHAYHLEKTTGAGHALKLTHRRSTDSAGIARCLGLQSEARLDLEIITTLIEQKITDKTRFDFAKPLPPVQAQPEE